MTTARSCLTSISRVSLACLPTRVQFLARVTESAPGRGAARRPLFYVKRDDETGSDLSGNKVRKLEFLLADALEQRADIVLTCGGIQSNHCRATAIAARRLGMDSLLFLRGEEPVERDGNLFLDSLVGAGVRFITPEQYADRRALMAQEAERLRTHGRRPYLIPEGGSNARGALGYIAMLEELQQQPVPSTVPPGLPARTPDVGAGGRTDGVTEGMPRWDHIVCAVGSGGTLAGLVLGAKILGIEARIWGVNVCDDARYFQDRVLEIAGELARSWSEWGIHAEVRSSVWEAGGSTAKEPRTRAAHADAGPPAVRREEICVLEGYVGPGYARPDPGSLQTIRSIAQSEGLLLDPVYTGKAFHGMLEEARRGRFQDGERVLFVHTGGVFSLFAYRRELSARGPSPS